MIRKICIELYIWNIEVEGIASGLMDYYKLKLKAEVVLKVGNVKKKDSVGKEITLHKK